ncbi:MAG: hypothetical protein ACYCOO_11875, partial [Chitinophagaceae bacterium]
MFFFVLLGMVILVFILSLIFPAEGHVEREGVIHTTPDIVFNQINELHNFNQWCPWGQPDSNQDVHFSNPSSG